MDGAERTDTLVIGAGPAGLAVGACLRRAGVPFRILEAADTVGASWHGHYRRLHLHTDRERSALPHRPFPAGTPRYPSRDQVIAYLRDYAEAFDLRPQLTSTVRSARRSGGRWRVRSDRGEHVAPRLVVATGAAATSHLPPLPGLGSFGGTRLHSRDYRDGAPFSGQRVLVVGGGNSGAEIALDLWEHGARPTLSVRGGLVVVPRELLGRPLLSWVLPLARLPAPLADALVRPILWAVYRDLDGRGVPRAPHGPFVRATRLGRVPVLDVGTVDLLRRGVLPVRPAVERFDTAGAHFADGGAEAFDAVVLATGFRPALDFLDAAATQDAERGLYLCGFRVVPTGMLREIGLEARRIAADVVARRRGERGAAASDTLEA